MKTRTIAVLVLFALAAALPAAAAFKLPAPEKLILKNGITVYFLKNAELPLVSFRLIAAGRRLGPGAGRARRRRPA